MRKLFTFFALMLVAVAVYADTKTLYCYVDKAWWTDGSAAVNCYAKVNGGDQMSEWPGSPMTQVVGVDNLWTIEIPSEYDKINFTRVNPADRSEYWGAKTDELDVPTSMDYYTITSDEGQWDSDKKTAAGEWSKKDAKFYIAGSMTSWETDKIGSLNDSYTLSLAAGKHQLKVVDLAGNWLGMGSMTDVAGGLYQDASAAICLQLEAAGDVVVTFVKDGDDIETFTVTGDFKAPSVALGAEWNSWTPTEDEFAVALDKKTASLKYTPTALPAANNSFGFQVVFDGDQWIARDGYWITRENHSVSGLAATGQGKNLIFRPDIANKEYTFTWTYATGVLDVTFPDHTYTIAWSLGAGADEALGELEKMGDSDVFAKYFDKDILSIGTYVVKVFEDDAIEPIATTELEIADVAKYYLEFDYNASSKTLTATATNPRTPTAVDNTEVEGKTVKVIRDGQLLIVKDGKTFNVLGTVVR